MKRRIPENSSWTDLAGIIFEPRKKKTSSPCGPDFWKEWAEATRKLLQGGADLSRIKITLEQKDR